MEASGLRLVLDIASPSSCSGDKATRPEPISEAGPARKSKKRASGRSLQPVSGPQPRSTDFRPPALTTSKPLAAAQDVRWPQPAKALHCVCRNCSACWNKPVSTAPLSKPAGGGPPPRAQARALVPFCWAASPQAWGLSTACVCDAGSGILAVTPVRLFFGLVLGLGLLGLDPGLLHWSRGPGKTGSRAAGNASQPRPCTPLPQLVRDVVDGALVLLAGNWLGNDPLPAEAAVASPGLGRLLLVALPRRAAVLARLPWPSSLTGGGPAGSAGRTEAVSTASARLPRSSSLSAAALLARRLLSPTALARSPRALCPQAPGPQPWPGLHPFPALAPRPRLEVHWAAPFALSWSSRKRCWRRTDFSCESSFFRPQPLSAGLPRRPSCPASSRPAQAVEVRLRKAGLRVWGLEFAVYRV